MADYISAWRCIGCGRIEAPQNCIGICRDRPVQFVYAKDHEAVLARALAAERALELVRKLAAITPRNENWKESYLALQREARQIASESHGGRDGVAAKPTELLE
jgi:hypothetical protein